MPTVRTAKDQTSGAISTPHRARVEPQSVNGTVNPAPTQDMVGNSKGKEQAELDLAQRHLEMAGETQPTTRGEHLALAQVHLLKALCIGFGVGMDES
jgi:hypothetical protein